MQLILDNRHEEVILVEDEEVKKQEVEAETLNSTVNNLFAKALQPIEKALAQDLPPMVKAILAIVAVLALLVISGLIGGLLYGIYALVAPLLADLLPFVLPAATSTLMFIFIAAVAIVLVAFLVFKGWDWIKALPRRTRKRLTAKAHKVMAQVQNAVDVPEMLEQGKRLLEI